MRRREKTGVFALDETHNILKGFAYGTLGAVALVAAMGLVHRGSLSLSKAFRENKPSNIEQRLESVDPRNLGIPIQIAPKQERQQTQPQSQPEQAKIDYRTNDFSRDSDAVLMARMLFGEARNCSKAEKIAIAYTAINRARDGKRWNGETVREAILARKQYSCFNENDINRKKLMDPLRYGSKSFYECFDIAQKVLNGDYADSGNGATHYYASTINQPAWAGKMRRIGKIDKHIFYKE